MTLLQEMTQEIKRRNFVAKHARLSGTTRSAGEHEVKTKFSKKKRLRDKQDLRKQADRGDY